MSTQGGGKGTIAKRLEADFGLRILGTGDMIRQHIREGTELGKKVQSIVQAGGLVPDDDVVDLVLATLNDQADGNYVLDGFPRTVPQAERLEEVVAPRAILNIDVPSETIVERLKDRLFHPGSGRIYNLQFTPPKVEGKDDVTGEPLVRRADDEPETVRARLAEYARSTAPIINYYGDRVVTFSGTETNKIYPEVQAYLKEVLGA
ncbi:uncharacterized protein MONBRDRAFT_21342 [Monosiga brevicollis MX1]|uniref:Adenylate kinase active site lid domain-containing protein n=1 Tax=Monosiga brevicollis TaxID=81824 RepID=A9UVJ8_MONBE|nr:uncharacterized protein MONBRDRAFT_21342 [Monosiga brevicollis MX1]EDQ90410.1 predicted protein [Monosiga brevicollis MX1]|eukprot:XP_001744461.1 hypothetical protein [Monosiga brevicollis MX1]